MTATTDSTTGTAPARDTCVLVNAFGVWLGKRVAFLPDFRRSGFNNSGFGIYTLAGECVFNVPFYDGVGDDTSGFAVTSCGELLTVRSSEVIIYDAEGTVLRTLAVPFSAFGGDVELSNKSVTVSGSNNYSAFSF